MAYVLRHSTGEYLGCQVFDDLDQALQAMNQIRRPWKFEQAGGCGGGRCGEGNCGEGNCKGGRCGLKQDGGSPEAGVSSCAGGPCRSP